MLSFFSSPDLRKLRSKTKKNEPVRLKNVYWNSELKLDHEEYEPVRRRHYLKSNSTSNADSLNSIELLRQHSSISTISLADTRRQHSRRDSTDSWMSNQESGTFWFLRNKRYPSQDSISKSKSSLYEYARRRRSEQFSESEEYFDTESESIYASKSDVNLYPSEADSIYTSQSEVNASKSEPKILGNEKGKELETNGDDDQLDEPNYLTMASILTIVDKERNKIIEEDSEEIDTTMDTVEEIDESPNANNDSATSDKVDKKDEQLKNKKAVSNVVQENVDSKEKGDTEKLMETIEKTTSPPESESWTENKEKMVSRRAILSRSRDDLAGDSHPEMFSSHSEDQWFSKEKLYKDHIIEVLSKWDSIDDEIWAKVIVLERNRRIAKAYARAPVLTVNGSEDGFDGFRIGVNGFDNPLRDNKTTEFKDQIGKGCKLKMDDSGNILVKRLSRSNIYVKNTMEENAVSNDILKLPNGLLEFEKPFKLFDMKKFQQNVNRELKRQYPERLKLETQCISTIALVKNEQEVLDSPIWIMLINVVALEMLKAKLPNSAVPQQKNLAAPFPNTRVSSDEDPYSLSPAESSGSSGKGPRHSRRDDSGERPVRDKDYYVPKNWAVRGEISDVSEEYMVKGYPRSRSKKTADHHQEDPYYHGLSARVPAFATTKQEKESINYNQASRFKSPPRGGVAQLPGPNPAWWHSRMYQEENPVKEAPAKSKNPLRNRVASPSRPAIFRAGWK